MQRFGRSMTITEHPFTPVKVPIRKASGPMTFQPRFEEKRLSGIKQSINIKKLFEDKDTALSSLDFIENAPTVCDENNDNHENIEVIDFNAVSSAFESSLYSFEDDDEE